MKLTLHSGLIVDNTNVVEVLKDSIEKLLPIEVVGTHNIKRDKDDIDAQFYDRYEVEFILSLVKLHIEDADKMLERLRNNAG